MNVVQNIASNIAKGAVGLVADIAGGLLPRVNWPIAGVLAVVLAGGIGYGVIEHYRSAAASAELETVTIERDNAQNAAKQIKHDADVAVAAAEADAQDAIERAAELQREHDAIDSAPATDDGPTAPVLKRAVDNGRHPAKPKPGRRK